MKTKITRSEEKVCSKAAFALAEACRKGGFSMDSDLWDKACRLMGDINHYVNGHRKADRT